MARSCKGLKLPVNSDKIRTNYVRAVNIRHLVSNGGWGGGFHICLYIYIPTSTWLWQTLYVYMLYHRKIILVSDYTKVAQ